MLQISFTSNIYFVAYIFLRNNVCIFQVIIKVYFFYIFRYLHVFIAKNSVQQAMQLIQLCPEKSWLNIQNDLGQTPLHLASYVNSNDIVMLLIHFGASIELTDKDGKNVFHLCAERGHIESFEAIVRMAYQTGQMQTVFQLLNSRDFEGMNSNLNFTLMNY